MEKIIFRREEKIIPEPKTGSLKTIVDRKRKNMSPLIGFFKEDEKFKLTKSLFNRDSLKFNSFMADLDTQETWHDAYLVIDSELKKRKIDILSKMAKELTDRVYQVYFPEDI